VVATTRRHEMVPGRNTLDAHAQDLEANDMLLLPIPENICTLHWLATLCSKCLMSSACV
jgi:hypothetical protein